MKKIIIPIALCFITKFSIAQCSSNIPCNNPIQTSPTNQAFVGDQCFSGTLLVDSTNSFTNWSTISVKGNVDIRSILITQSGKSVYSNGLNHIKSIYLKGGNNIYVTGQRLDIDSLLGTTTGLFSTSDLYLINGATFYYQGVQYFSGDNINFPAGYSNSLHITGCSASPASTIEKTNPIRIKPGLMIDVYTGKSITNPIPYQQYIQDGQLKVIIP